MTIAYAMLTLGSLFLYSGLTDLSVFDILRGTAGTGSVSDQPLFTSTDLATGAAASNGSVTAGSQKGSSTYKGVEICNWIIAIIKQAENDVGPLQPTSGLRPTDSDSNHRGCTGGLGAVDFGGYGGSPDATKFANWLAKHGYPMRPAAKATGGGFHDLGHFSKTGH